MITDSEIDGNGERGTGSRNDWLIEYGKRHQAKILRWVGIPCGVGFAHTKTLAKIANHIGKKLPDGVFVLPEDPTDILASLPADEVWGVGRRLAEKLRADQIFTAKDLRDASDRTIRYIGGVTLLRTAFELRGEPCNDDKAYDADPDSVSCSRSFGEPVTTLEGLEESIASFTAQAATKLRKHRMLAAGCNIYAQIFSSSGVGDCIVRTVVFPAPTDATNAMMSAIHPEIPALFLSGTRYRKTGVVFFGLESTDAPKQLDLFSHPSSPFPHPSKLYKTIDALNARYGKGKVFSARHSLTLGLPTSPWVIGTRKGRLCRRHRRALVENEAVEALETSLDALGRADGGEVMTLKTCVICPLERRGS